MKEAHQSSAPWKHVVVCSKMKPAWRTTWGKGMAFSSHYHFSFLSAFVKNIIVFSVYTSRPNKLLCCSSNGNKPQFLGMTIQTKSRWFSESFQIGVTPRRVWGFPKYMNTLECCWFFSLNCSWVATAASEKLECKNHNKHAILLQKFAKYAHSCRKRIGAYVSVRLDV